MAQAGGILAHKLGYFDASSQVVLFMGMDKVRFRRPVTPGDQLLLDVKPLRKGKVWKMTGEAKVGDQVASEAEFLATVMDRSALQF
jgi:3-hydroxymyristoyl/3-hydroxydecanoyl-(acyl carrier protein) dehydratase